MKENTFDIFSGKSHRDALWLEAVRGFAAARDRMKQLAAEKPGPYFLFSAESGSVLLRVQAFQNRGMQEMDASAA